MIHHFQMEPMGHESLFFRQTYAAVGKTPEGIPNSTATVALMTDAPDSFSDMHRLSRDEVWHFYLGDPIELLLLNNGQHELRVLGPDVLAGELIQTVVPAGVWMGARVRPGGDWAVFGNTVAPGFTLDCFEAGDADELARAYPACAALIRALVRS